MKYELLYVELKSGFSDNGPAWIGRGSRSKSGRTIYFNDQAFHPLGGQGIKGNYINIETRDEYWISGVKKNQEDRHWAGSGIIMIDEQVVEEYLTLVGSKNLDERKFKIVQLNQGDVRSRIHEHLNKKLV
jgi:hypothetical protein